jgi:quercetin dioxygenase-like cupin family protein
MVRLALAWVCGALLAMTAIAGHAAERRLLDAPLTNAPGRQLTAITVDYAPGQSSRAHRHTGAAFVYVLAGQVRSALAGQPERVYRAGESWFEPPGAHHVVSANASADKPARLLVVFIAVPGEPLSVMDAAGPARPSR